jgi:hypothetical protein
MSDLPTQGNAVVYSEKAWAVARRASGGDDKWFPDSGAWSKGYGVTSEQLIAWTDDWVEMVPRG